MTLAAVSPGKIYVERRIFFRADPLVLALQKRAG
jgi:hypothetical protein